ncbi:SDR family oxidoreductase [candidate division KSB1 bacterium]
MKFDKSDLFCHDLPTIPQPGIGKILVTGATGYIGGRLVPELILRGYKVRVLVRNPSGDYSKRWPGAEIIESDILEDRNLKNVFEGIHTAYYLIHSLHHLKREHKEDEIKVAANFCSAAEKSNLNRIIYLGNILELQKFKYSQINKNNTILSEFIKSKIPVTFLGADMIIGSGSVSFELFKNLSRRYSVIFLSKWWYKHFKPIAIRDVIKYLVGVLELPDTQGKYYFIGGKDTVPGITIFETFADVFNKKLSLINIPFINIVLESYILSLITPLPSVIIRGLFEELNSISYLEHNDIKKTIPIQLLSLKESVTRAVAREEQNRVDTRWSDAHLSIHNIAVQLHELKDPPNFIKSYTLSTQKKTGCLFKVICSIGGEKGWFHSNILWRLRGAVDRIFLGVGITRGRRSSTDLRINDVIDFWRVEKLETDYRLLLRAEMRLPGVAWLELKIEPEDTQNRLQLTAYFKSDKIFGKFYWYIFLPFHELIFPDMIREIEKSC